MSKSGVSCSSKSPLLHFKFAIFFAEIKIVIETRDSYESKVSTGSSGKISNLFKLSINFQPFTFELKELKPFFSNSSKIDFFKTTPTFTTKIFKLFKTTIKIFL